MTTFGTLDDALATLPPNCQLRAYRKTGGAPALVSHPSGGDVWDPAAFRSAFADGTVSPKAQYIIRPVVGGKMSSRKIQLDLSLSQSEQTVQVDTGGGAAAADTEAAQGGYLVQESVMNGLMTAWSNDRGDMSDLREENQSLRQELTDLKLRIKDLEHALVLKGKDEGLSQMVSQWGLEFFRGPGAAIAASRLLGVGAMTDAVADAAKKAAGEVK